MRDRAILGGISGIVGSVFCTLYEVIAESLKITDRSFLDYTATLVANKVYPGTLGFIVAFLAQAAVGILFGVVFVYLTKIISSRYYLLKGLGYGFALWFLLSGFGIIFKLPTIMDIPPTVSLFDLTNALLYGLITAYIIKILGHKFTELGN
ncbi:MAG: hypothetical protein ACYCV0_03485 [Desulfitobacteriaceae bacterium]